MKIRSSFVAVLALGGVASAANAAFITDTTTFTATGTDAASTGDLDGYGYGAVNRLDGTLDYVSWTHHFDPTVGTVTSGTLDLYLRDDNGWLDGIEIAFGFAESGQWGFGLVSTAKYTYDVALSSLLDGAFSVTLVSILGDFFIDKSVLTVNYTSTNVPEPTTLSLLGAGLLGAAFGFRRRTKKSASAI